MSQGKPRKFTSEELKQFNGLSGQPLYIVFKGKVYDLTSSKLWPQGKHMGMHTRSDNLTEAIKRAPHSARDEATLSFSFPQSQQRRESRIWQD